MRNIFILLICCFAVLASPVKGDEPSAPTQTTAADDLWQRLLQVERQGPAQGATNDADRKSNQLKFLNDVEKLCDQFGREFPNDKRIWEAKLDKLQVIMSRYEVNDQVPDATVVDAITKEIIAAADASKPVKAQASLIAMQAHARLLVESPQPGKLAEFEKEYADFLATYPNDRGLRHLPFMRLEVYEKVDPAKAAAIVKEMASDKNPAIVAEAKRRMKAAEFKTKPLELKFTAVDGKEFDIAKLRGKVVLVDFWATWCGPCRMEIPNVVATYKKLHEKGFEIVGISLDSQKDKLVEYTKEKDMTWPQYFDGKGWGNEVSGTFGITGIPTMWLVDKKGFVRSTEARANLESQITKLLAE